MGKARDEWAKHVTEACTDFRLNCIQQRPKLQYQDALIRAAVSEVAALRIEKALMPLLFGPLMRIEKLVGVLADLRREPWASPTHPVNR